MAHGLRLSTVWTKNPYASVSALFERVRDERFTAGRPALVTSGPAQAIVFPPLDRQNQVSFMLHGRNCIRVQRSPLPGGARPSGGGAAPRGNAGLVERLIEATAAELEALDL